MHVAVAIVGFRNAEDVGRCLVALSRSTYSDFEVIVCENGGQDACRDLKAIAPASLKGGQQVRIVCPDGNRGFAGGVNLCISETPDADAWWVLNPDTEPHPDALAAKVRRLREGDCEAVGCTLYRANGRIQSVGGKWISWLARAESIGLGDSLEEVVDAEAVEREQRYLNGAAMLVSRRFVERVGLMREDYFLYCEEVEWCLRALDRGVKLGFAPDARVLHAQGTTTGAGEAASRRPRLPIYLSARNSLLLTRDLFPFRLPVAAPAAMLQLMVRYGRHGAWRQVGYAFSGLAAGLRNERDAPVWMGR
ncbi:glycosyltransferase family 2 protein [Phenylobacterium koreense]